MGKNYKIIWIICLLLILLVSVMIIKKNYNDKAVLELNGEHTGDFDEEKYETSIYQFIISNQSYEVPSVNLKCYIDGELIFSDQYRVMDQHQYAYYFFDFEPGEYELLIESEYGKKMIETITISDFQQHAYITYDSDGEKEYFNYYLSDKPIGLD